MSRGIFITGTDTGVGKTLVAAGIVRWLRSQWIDAVPMKPVQTGAEKHDSVLIAPDLEFCLSASGLQPDPDERRWMSPYLYEPACSPHLAGRMAGRYPDISVIQKSSEIILRRRQAVIVEGAGGIMVPLNENETMLDLMKALGLPVVLVSRIALGAVNHALLSVNTLSTAGLDLAGIVFNQNEPPVPENRYIEEDNPAIISRFGKVRVLGNIGYFDNTIPPEEIWRQFEQSMPGLEYLGEVVKRG
jgi:dethiobiotin synthetase